MVTRITIFMRYILDMDLIYFDMFRVLISVGIYENKIKKYINNDNVAL